MPKTVRQFYSASSLARGFCVWGGKLCVCMFGEGKVSQIVFHVTRSFKYFCRIAWLWLHTQKLCDDDEVNGTTREEKVSTSIIAAKLNRESISITNDFDVFESSYMCALLLMDQTTISQGKISFFNTNSLCFFLHPSKYYTSELDWRVEKQENKLIDYRWTKNRKQNRIQQLGTLLKDVNYCKVQLSGQTTLSQEWDEIHHTESELRTWQGIENSPPEKHFMSSSEAERTDESWRKLSKKWETV